MGLLGLSLFVMSYEKDGEDIYFIIQYRQIRPCFWITF